MTYGKNPPKSVFLLLDEETNSCPVKSTCRISRGERGDFDQYKSNAIRRFGDPVVGLSAGYQGIAIVIVYTWLLLLL